MASEAEDAEIQMTATVNNNEIKHDLTMDGDWSCVGEDENAVCTRSWGVSEFTQDGEDPEITFDADNLILKKSVAAGCKTAKVDDVTVCLQKGHKLDFTCTYPLGTTTVTNTYDVAGHDTSVSKEGTGKLNYKLTATENVKIGEKVTVKIEAVNKGLVWHALQDCTVSYEGQSVSILNWYADDKTLISYCPNVLGASAQSVTDLDKTELSWNAFKWSTAADETYLVEQQTIQCKISLSKSRPTVFHPHCDTSYTKTEGGNCFKAGENKVKAYEAHGRNGCEMNYDYDAYVPIPSNDFENDDLQAFAKDAGFSHIFIGVEDYDEEGNYVSRKSKQVLSWYNWAANQPSASTWDEDYAEMIVETGEWNDIPEHSKKNFVCQKKSYLC